MTTIRQISEDSNPCRDIVEGIVKLPTIRTEPAHEFICPPAPSDELPQVELPSKRIIQKFQRAAGPQL
ncbi:MAG: hypothetical protein P4N60_19250 [Verrucomicrobiae bacterium]|nr:hypothetical protein [Verrucomicrobiae bacterium]